ncbi:exonuclease [Ralstonia phage RSP15]|uniref:exonuclease n=1 Tax=Ralstonia phage RSP15 TaxID=1785960 RepID=UPI00074D2D1C|nr:exonuclease [Ralstonia phage RSP15]BAU40107.1 exonuclease [Ralstonia phage RSP15]
MREGSKGFVSIDAETLGLYHDSVILSVGLVVSPWKYQTVEELMPRSINIKLDVRDQISNYGLKVHKNVTDWWKKQDEKARSILNPSINDVKLAELPGIIESFIKGQGYRWFELDTYDRRNFDVVKMQYIYEEVLGFGHGNVPWNFSNIYEFGTALAYLGADRYGGVRPEDVGLIYHNSQHDAILDAYRLLKCMKEVEIIS